MNSFFHAANAVCLGALNDDKVLNQTTKPTERQSLSSRGNHRGDPGINLLCDNLTAISNTCLLNKADEKTILKAKANNLNKADGKTILKAKANKMKLLKELLDLKDPKYLEATLFALC